MQKFTEQAIRYFLGELSEGEQSAVEERFFADEDYSHFLDAVENVLIDDYVGGRLGFRQTQNFESIFLISRRRREKVRSAQTRQTVTFTENEKAVLPFTSSISFWRRFENLFRIPNLAWAGGLAAIMILILTGILRLENSPEKNQIVKIEYENQMPVESSTVPPSDSNIIQKQSIRREKLKSAAKTNLEKREKPRIAPRVKSNPMPSVTLLPPMQNADKPLIVGAREIDNIRLRVVHNNAENFIKYRVEIHASDGDTVWSREISISKNKSSQPLTLNIESDTLKPATYELTLLGVTPDGQYEETNFYNFVVRKN